MKNRRHIALGLTAFLLVGAAAMPASAKPAAWKHSSQNFKAERVETRFAPSPQTLPRWAQRKISASEAKSIARKRAGGGEVVDISRNGNTYRVRVIRKDGRVVDVFIDATTGRVK